jgi:hypothetical protein
MDGIIDNFGYKFQGLSKQTFIHFAAQAENASSCFAGAYE